MHQVVIQSLADAHEEVCGWPGWQRPHPDLLAVAVPQSTHRCPTHLCHRVMGVCSYDNCRWTRPFLRRWRTRSPPTSVCAATWRVGGRVGRSDRPPLESGIAALAAAAAVAARAAKQSSLPESLPPPHMQACTTPASTRRPYLTCCRPSNPTRARWRQRWTLPQPSWLASRSRWRWQARCCACEQQLGGWERLAHGLGSVPAAAVLSAALHLTAAPAAAAPCCIHRSGRARRQFVEFAEAAGLPYACMAAAKGLVPEQHEQFMGTVSGARSAWAAAAAG